MSDDRNAAPSAHPAAPASRWLLWSAAAAVVILSLAAFMIWGIHGPGILLDMIVALCF